MNFTKPETALRHSQEYKSVGKTRDAMETLHNFLTGRKLGRTWQQIHEDMVLEFLTLCVELKAGREAKDGLIHYRNTTQSTNPSSLEKVINALVEMALRKTAEARAKVSATASNLESIEDLEDAKSPEELMMRVVTSENHQDRMEREVLVPWVRFMWDTFRNILDVLRSSRKLEHVYHGAAVRAFEFLVEFERRTEFHRLCDTLRRHLSFLRQSESEPISPETLDRHLMTRFAQLQNCSKLQLWNEAFRTVEDIHGIIQTSRTVVKPNLMASYYEHLAQVFWVSENHLFHAYAWYKFYRLSATQNRALTEEQKQSMATAVVLSALCIPTVFQADEVFDIDLEKDKKHRLAALLNFNSSPSREALLATVDKEGILSSVPSEIASLFSYLEVDIHPLSIVAKVNPILESLRTNDSFSKYVPIIEKLLVYRLLQQLTRVYRTVSISSFQSLTSCLTLTFHDVEKVIVRAVKSRQLQVRIDHQSGCLRLGEDAIENEHMRRQLTLLATRLRGVVEKIHPEDSHEAAARREQLFDEARRGMASTTEAIHRRKHEIERRKEQSEREKEAAIRKEADRRRAEEEERKAAEEIRQREAKARREREKLQAMRDKEAVKDVKRLMEIVGQDATKLDVADVRAVDRQKLEQEAREKAEQQRQEARRKLVDQAKRLDALCRALRLAERTRIEADREVRAKQDREYYESRFKEQHDKKLAAHTQSMAIKARLSKVLPFVESFEDSVKDRRGAELREAMERRRAFEAVERQRAKEAAEKLRQVEAERAAERAQDEAAAAAAAEMAAAAGGGGGSGASSNWRKAGSRNSAAVPEASAAEPPSAAAPAVEEEELEDGWQRVGASGSTATSSRGGAGRGGAGRSEGGGASGSGGGGSGGGGGARGGWRERAAAGGDGGDSPGGRWRRDGDRGDRGDRDRDGGAFGSRRGGDGGGGGAFGFRRGGDEGGRDGASSGGGRREWGNSALRRR